MTTTQEPQRRSRTYGNWTRPRTAGLLGLGQIGTGILFGGMVLAIIVTIASNLASGLVVMAVVGVLLLLTAVRDKHGQSAFARPLSSAFSTASMELALTPVAAPIAAIARSAKSPLA